MLGMEVPLLCMVSSSGITAWAYQQQEDQAKSRICSIALLPPDRSPQPKPHYCPKRAFGKSCTTHNCAKRDSMARLTPAIRALGCPHSTPWSHSLTPTFLQGVIFKGKEIQFLLQPALLQVSDWLEQDKCRQGRLALHALFSFSQEERFFFHAIMSSSIPLATLTAHPSDQSGPQALSENPPSNPSPPQPESSTKPDAESSAMAASMVADGQSSATTIQGAIEKADDEPWR